MLYKRSDCFCREHLRFARKSYFIHYSESSRLLPQYSIFCQLGLSLSRLQVTHSKILKAIYNRKFYPQDLPVESLTYVLYAFANVHPDTGEIYLSDLWANIEKRYPGIRGTRIRTISFASSAVNLIRDLGFNGIDINWEYPANNIRAENIVTILRKLRASNVSGHNANIYLAADNPLSTLFNTDTAVKFYISKGIDTKKLMLGMPLYSRSFIDTNSPNKSYSGVGSGS
ncbi:glycoside hydrolase superfamily [Penicillium maclennaniae]|uniref:glycoside hydrolase superfamily n=1 Tax=Penicillium maclennaniae TaxID=1343394 RepID=UPI0025409D09|nr:glycoside hydrolase superfamily [Penicillium maclennaniae]KAJ5661905.1 glycoside hydrolase superfamily [Penicillium maclennaniae]